MFSKEADVFFELPTQNRTPLGIFGVLYLLRRDIFTCLGIDSDTSISHKALWPGAMGIFAGIDLMAKFWKGNDQSGQVGQRFKDFINTYFMLSSQEDAEAVYQLRNSLLHSFGLYSKGNGKVYRFFLSACHAPLVHHIPPEVYQFDLLTLHGQFENAITLYQQKLETDMKLQENFMKMYPNYGALKIE